MIAVIGVIYYLLSCFRTGLDSAGRARASVRQLRGDRGVAELDQRLEDEDGHDLERDVFLMTRSGSAGIFPL